jgi:hypothetical protein
VSRRKGPKSREESSSIIHSERNFRIFLGSCFALRLCFWHTAAAIAREKKGRSKSWH